jgi:hypothetical protein
MLLRVRNVSVLVYLWLASKERMSVSSER